MILLEALNDGTEFGRKQKPSLKCQMKRLEITATELKPAVTGKGIRILQTHVEK